MVWHWNCASSLCQNSWRTKGVRYYTLPVDPELRRKYNVVLKNENIDWEKHVICSAHWSKGERESPADIPDIICSEVQQRKFKSLLKTNPSRELRKKVACVHRILGQANREVGEDIKCELTRKRNAAAMVNTKSETAAFRCEDKAKKRKVNVSLEDQNTRLHLENRALSEKVCELEKLQQEMKAYQERLVTENDSFKLKIEHMNFEINKRKFSYSCLRTKGKEFFEMCGLTVNEFDCLFACLEPFVNLIVYPDCVKNKEKDSNNKLMDIKTELLVTLTVARHAVDLTIMAKLVGGSSSTISRVFVAWIVFIRSVLDEVNLKPLPGFIEAFLPKVFVDAGYSDCGILGDNTETWIAQSENFELNNLTFSHYKNHTTGKVSVWIFPHGALCKCSDAFPGSISDEQLTQQIDVIDYCPKGKVVMTDKGFAISDLCHEKGVHHNRPPMKFEEQYDEHDINLNFDIATLRIYNENAIGRIRDWSILNRCWHPGRVDLLGACWIALAHIVNLTKKPVGPKES